jgi:hypothetical protein
LSTLPPCEGAAGLSPARETPCWAHIRKLNTEYGFNLSEDEIKLIVQQAEETERLLRPLNELELIDVMPLLKVEKKKVKK